MAEVRAIFFDIGDTLLFDEPPLRERVFLAMDSVGIAYDKEKMPRALRAAEDYALARYLEGVGNDSVVVQEGCARIILSALGNSDKPMQANALVAAFLVVPFTRRLHPQAISLVRELRARGFKVGAISDWEKDLAELLTELALFEHLDALAVSSVVGATKPAPTLFDGALAQAGVTASESLHVGDFYELDVAGARSAGMAALLFDWRGRAPDADCERVTTFEELSWYLLGLPAPRCAAG